ncbi:MAG: YjbQ family protein [Chloroflexi bacterium]|nr:YjbQ family protein [Chloroflexota bacterium]
MSGIESAINPDIHNFEIRSEMPALTISTSRQREIVDITDRIALIVRGSGLRQGLCHLFVQHTTAALTLASQEPGVSMDMLDAFQRLIPVLEYSHQPAQHVPSHILSATIGASLVVPIRSGALALGVGGSAASKSVGPSWVGLLGVMARRSCRA